MPEVTASNWGIETFEGQSNRKHESCTGGGGPKISQFDRQ